MFLFSFSFVVVVCTALWDRQGSVRKMMPRSYIRHFPMAEGAGEEEEEGKNTVTSSTAQLTLRQKKKAGKQGSSTRCEHQEETACTL